MARKYKSGNFVRRTKKGKFKKCNKNDPRCIGRIKIDQVFYSDNFFNNYTYDPSKIKIKSGHAIVKTFKAGDPIRITKKGLPKICEEDDPRKCGYVK